MCVALYTAAVDPDEVLRLFRRVSFRSALTATLATRMVPVLARDARRFADAQRCRPGRPPSRLALRARRDHGRAGPRGRRGGHARGARLRRRSAAAAGAAAVVAARPRVRRRRAGRAALGRRAGRRAGAFAAYPPLDVPVGARRARDRARRSSRARCCRSPSAGGSCDERRVARARGRHLLLSGRAAAGARDVSLVGRAGRARRRSRARRDRGSRRCCVPPAGSCRTSTAASVRRARVGRRDGHARARPGQLAAAVGTLFQDPETQVVMGTVRAELAFALENRGELGGRRSRAASRRRRSRSGSPQLLERPTVGAVRRRAPARRARRGARRPAAAGRAGRADLAARPGRRRRADRAAAAAQRGVRGDGRARRAPPRALPGDRRPRDRDGRRRGSCATRRRASSWRGRARPRPALATPARGCLQGPG